MPDLSGARKILFVVNPTSGKGSKEKWMSAIMAYFKGSPHRYDWYEMTGTGDAASMHHWISDYKPDRVVAVGGDGTLKFLAEQTLYSGLPIAFLPAGSANGMAAELNVPKDATAAIRLAVEGASKKMDVVRINGHASIHLSDIGLNAQLIKYFEQSDSRGMWGYVREVFKVMRRKEQINLQLIADGRQLERTAWMVVIANARLYGTGAAINPDGSIHDGKFEVVLLKQLSIFEIIKMVLRNRRLNRKKTEILSVEKLQLRTDAPVYFQVDGEYIGTVDAVEANIEREAVDIVVGN